MSTLPVFLVPAVPPPGPFELGGAEGRHAAAVRRLRPGERLMLCDGRGGRAAAAVLSAARESLTVQVEPMTIDPEPAIRIVLVQALVKGERSDLAVDLATQAGVDAIVPWQAARCVTRWTAEKAGRGRDRWQSVAREAAKQSRRSRVPEVLPIASTDQVAAIAAQAAGCLVLDEDGSVPLAGASLPTAGRLVLVIGPEGGLAPEELDAFTAVGAVAVRLGPEVLRASAAAAVALGALGVLAGRWQ